MSSHRARPLVAVVGDVLLDRDICGRAERFSPDGPVPVVEGVDRRSRPGGAGLAALLAAADADVVLVTALGDDDDGEEIASCLGRSGIELVVCPSHEPTSVKTRVRAGEHTVVRFDEGGASTRPATVPARAAEALAAAHGLLVSDYGRGMTASSEVRRALAGALGGRPSVWDPHPAGGRPVAGTRIVTPNLPEVLRLTTSRPPARGEPADGGAPLTRYTEAARALASEWSVPAVAVTLGAQGALLVDGPGPPMVVPAPGASHGDTCGAGDCFAAAAATAMARGAVLSEAVVHAVDRASAFVAGGAASSLASSEQPPSDPGEALRRDPAALVEEVRSRGATVVATGGCFDILHAGHVSLLESARALGDCLVVCLNSDDSVRRLKGPERPVVPAADRAAVLASLACVDAVAVFDEDTPAAILDRLRPDVFVKGGDYAHVDMVESRLLESWGGQVVVVPYLPGRSTSRIIAEARAREVPSGSR